MTERARHGARRRCSDPHGTGCKQFARRNSVPASCAGCGGGTRAATNHGFDEEGRPKATARGLVSVPARVQQLLDGSLPIEELDDEELARGYPRAEDGSFRNPPKLIPRAIHQRMMRELFDRAGSKLRANLVGAVETMTSIALNPENDPKVRLQASVWLVERVMGKTPDVTVNVEEKAYEKLLMDLDRTAIVIDMETDGREA